MSTRHIALCDTCGVVDEQLVDHEDADEPMARRSEPSTMLQHYRRTGHTVIDVEVDDVPTEIVDALNRGEDVDFDRVAELCG